MRDTVAIDFFTVPTARLRVLFVLVVLAHDRRRVVYFNVTESIRLPNGRHSNSLRPFHGSHRRSTYCVIAMLSMEITFENACAVWE
jgi:hypothetical protein